jgi:Protein of unknown function (DUF998)
VATTLALLALVATLACIASLTWVHLLPTGYRPVRNAVSDYGVGRYRAFYRAQTTANAIAAMFLAGALGSGVDPAPRRVIVLLLVFAAARLVIPWFPTDIDRAAPTSTGRVHVMLAGVAFASVAWAAAALPGRVDWPGIHGLLVALGWVVVATAIVCGVAMTRMFHAAMEPFFGLIERCFYAAMITWFLVVSIRLI